MISACPVAIVGNTAPGSNQQLIFHLRSHTYLQRGPCRVAPLPVASSHFTKATGGHFRFQGIPLLPAWLRRLTGLWTMKSPPLLHLDSPGAPQHCSPCRDTPIRDRPCALWDSLCCCCCFWWFVAFGSCWILTAACRHQHGWVIKRGLIEGSLIMQ